jgi:hypothetical protein
MGQPELEYMLQSMIVQQLLDLFELAEPPLTIKLLHFTWRSSRRLRS